MLGKRHKGISTSLKH